MCTKGRLLVFIIIFVLLSLLEARTPVSRQATFLEVFHNGVVEVQATGRYVSDLGSPSRRRDDIRRNGESNAIVDARLSAIYFLLHSGPAPLLRDGEDRMRFQTRGLFVYEPHNLTRYITFEDARSTNVNVANDNQSISLVRTLRIDRERLFRELQNAMVIGSDVELGAIGQSMRDEPGTEVIEVPVAVEEPEVVELPVVVETPPVVIEEPVHTITDAERAIERAIASISVTGSRMERTIARSVRTLIKDMPLNAEIFVLSISSNDEDESMTVIDGIISRLFSVRRYTGYRVVERERMAAIRSELNLRASSETDEASDVSLGEMTGAEIMITGRLTGRGNQRMLTLNATNVRTTELVAHSRERVN